MTMKEMRYEGSRANKKYEGNGCAGEEVMVVVVGTSLLSLSPLEATRNIGRPVGRLPSHARPGLAGPDIKKTNVTIPLLSPRHVLPSGRPRRSPLTSSVRSSSIRLCRMSIESSLLSHSSFPNVASFSSVSSAVSGSNNRSDR